MTKSTSSTMTAVVTTAVELSTKQLGAIKKALVGKYGEQVTVQTVVDSAMIGGIKIRVGSIEFNSTLKAKFDSLRSQLIAKVS